MDFNYEIKNKEFENDKVWVIILKLLTIITLKTMVEFNPNLNLKIFDLPNKKFEPNEIIVFKHSIKEFKMKKLTDIPS